MSRFDDIKVGDRAELVHMITAEDVEKFVDLTGDDNRIHVDRDYASQKKYKKPRIYTDLHGFNCKIMDTPQVCSTPGFGLMLQIENKNLSEDYYRPSFHPTSCWCS